MFASVTDGKKVTMLSYCPTRAFISQEGEEKKGGGLRLSAQPQVG
jgi:hypothetical protein